MSYLLPNNKTDKNGVQFSPNQYYPTIKEIQTLKFGSYYFNKEGIGHLQHVNYIPVIQKSSQDLKDPIKNKYLK